MKVYVTALVVFAIFCRYGNAQKLSNVRATLDSSSATINILYDLEATMEGQLFQVNLYSSHNNFSAPLLLVTGQVGHEITPGINKQIVWDPKELINFKGHISFDVKAVLTFSPFAVKTPTLFSRHKRGKRLTITWKGGTTREKVNLELYHNGEKTAPVALIGNTGEYRWILPSNTRPGEKYQIKISSETRPDNFQLSEVFSIRRRVPLILKTVPVVVGAIGAYFLLYPPPPPPPPGPLPEPG